MIILLLENGRSVRINDRFILQYQKDIFGKELSQFYPIMMVNGNYQLQLPTETISFVSRYVSEGRSECTHGELILHVDRFLIIATTGNIRDEERIFSIHSMQSGFTKFIYNC